MKKLAIVITHPVQYYVPVFQLLAKQCLLKVFYTWGKEGISKKYDPGFRKVIGWDLSLLEGYDYELLQNTSKSPGSHHGKGIINPHIITKITDFKPHAILIYGYSYHSHFKVMRHFKGKTPIWFRGDSTLLDRESPLKSLLKKHYLKWVYSHIDKAFYVGTNNKAYFKKYGLKENQLVFAPHAIDNERFAEDRKKEALELRENLRVGKDEILILFAGKLEPKKNPALLLEAFIELIKEKPFNPSVISDECEKSISEISPPANWRNVEMMVSKEVHLLFVGNGVLEESLKLKVKSSALNNIHFMDFQNQTQIPVMYQASDIFCLPSQGPGETWGLAINEAMATGKAIITSDKVGCAVDLIKNEVNGYIFPSNDINVLKEKIASLIHQPSLIKSFGQQSQKIIQHWSFKQQVEQLISALKETN